MRKQEAKTEEAERAQESRQLPSVPEEPRPRKRKREIERTRRRVRHATKKALTSEASVNITEWDQRKARWIMKDSRPPPMVLVQVQVDPLQGPFQAAPAKIVAMLADTGAQINCANESIFDALGIKPEDREKYLRPSEITVNGVGGEKTVVKELRVQIYSLKTRKTHRITFYDTLHRARFWGL